MNAPACRTPAFTVLLRAELPVVAMLAAAGVAFEQALPAALAAAALFWLVRFVALRRFTARTPADWPLAVLVLLMPVTLWATALPEVTREEVLRLAVGIALYYAVVNGAWAIGGSRTVALGLLAAGLALAVIAPLGMPEASGLLALAPAALRRGTTALFAGAINPNVLAGITIALWPLAVALPLFAWKKLLGWERTLTLSASLAILGVAVLGRSRGALMGAATGMLVLIVLRWPRGWLALPLTAAASVLAVWRMGIGALANALTPAGVLSGADGRLEIWSRALYMIQDFPFTGIGMGTFRQVVNLLYPFFLAGPDAEIPHAHNLFLQVAVDLGIGGLVAWLAVFGLVVLAGWLIWRAARQRGLAWHAGLGAGILACQAAIAVHGLTDAPTWGTRPAVLVWGLWGLAMAALTETDAK